MTVVGVVIARMGSTRLPGKVLTFIKGGVVLGWVTTAVRNAQFIDRVVVATSLQPPDDRIEQFCHDVRLPCFRGSERDVLGRVAGAVRSMLNVEEIKDAVVVRVTGDCPFLDTGVIDQVVKLQQLTGAAYVSNVDPRTWPDGLDVEAFTAEALFAAEAEATRPIDRDCVTTWIRRNRSRFPAEALICPLPRMERERWVLDTAEDLKFCREVAQRLHFAQHPANWLEILALLDREPELRRINAHRPVNERYYEAIANEPIIERKYPRSQAQFEKAHKVIPLAAQTFSKSYVQFPQPAPLFVTHGEGGVVWDVDGNEYVDLVSALLPNILGYRDPDVDAAIRRQLAAGISFSLATELEEALASRLLRLIPCAEMVRFGKNGSDVTTAAVRLARAYRKRDWIAIVDGAYHGWHDWAIAGTPRERGVVVSQRVVRLPEQGILDNEADWAGVIVDPGNHDREFLEALRAKCDAMGWVLIFDEIITGFRYALGGAQEFFDVMPDLACFGKAMANGMPISAIVGRSEIMRLLEPPNPCVFFSGTFGGEALSLAAAIATIDKLERGNVAEMLRGIGASLRVAVQQLIRDAGLAQEIFLRGHDSRVLISMPESFWPIFRNEMIASGTLIINAHNVCAAHTPGDIKRVLASWRHTLAKLKEAM